MDEFIVTHDKRIVLNPRHVERVVMKQRWEGNANAQQFRVDAYTPDDCHILTAWTDEPAALTELLRVGELISLV